MASRRSTQLSPSHGEPPVFRWLAGRLLHLGLTAIGVACAVGLAALTLAPGALAGNYPMYQCGANGDPAVASGWATFADNTDAIATIDNTCSSPGGSLGDQVQTGGQPGVVDQTGSSGSDVGLQLLVPSSAPDVTIKSIAATTQVSPVTGNDTSLSYTSLGTQLGSVALPSGASAPYTASDTWTLPANARIFEAIVGCSTDMGTASCSFADPTLVPALSDVTMTLAERQLPAITATSGALATASAAGATVSGTQDLSVSSYDKDSGVRSATIWLTAQNGGGQYATTVDYGAQCAYDSWNACPTTQTGSILDVNTAAVPDGTYSVTLYVKDAANNANSRSLGTIVTQNAPAITSSPTITGTTSAGDTLTAVPGSVSSDPGAAPLTSAGQWLLCDQTGGNCSPIPAATDTTYQPDSTDVGQTIRYQQTATNSAGSTTAASSPTGPITPAAQSGGSTGGTGTTTAGGTSPPDDGGGATTTGGTGGGATATAVPPGMTGVGFGGAPTGVPAGTPTRPTSGTTATVGRGTRAPWRASLAVAGRTGRAVRLVGRVLSTPRPPEGKLVYLEARSVTTRWRGHGRARRRVAVYGRWVTFAGVRADSSGRFATMYRFAPTRHCRYQFRAVAPREPGYRNQTGRSVVVTVEGP